MPYTTRADGDVLTASSHNANCRDQVVSTVTSATRPSGTEGQIIYETDTDFYYAYNGGWIPFGTLGAWASYTPTLTQSSAIAKTVTTARYQKLGRFMMLHVRLDVTGTGTANQPIGVTLPFNPASAGPWVGSGIVYDSSAGLVYPGICAIPATTLHMTDSTQATAVNTYIGQTGAGFADALGSGDIVNFTAVYESST